MPMSRRLIIATILGFSLLHCGTSQDGPAPAEADKTPTVDPSAVCVEQLTTTVKVYGTGISPLPSKVMEDNPLLLLPGMELTLIQDIEGKTSNDAPVKIPDDPNAPESSQIHWISQKEIHFTITPELGLKPGLYGIRVTNANGNQGEWRDALLAVPRPQAQAVSPDILCSGKSNQLTISGTFFLRNGPKLPVIKITPKGGGSALELTPVQMNQCTILPGSSGIEACKELKVDLQSGALSSGDHYQNYEIVIQNPDPMGCHTTEALTLTMVPEPEITRSEPDLVCTAQGDNSIKITGKNFLTIDGHNPTVTIGTKTFSTVATNCTTVDGPKEKVESCTTLTTTVKKGEFEPNSYHLKVQNPAPADCISSKSIAFTVVPPPQITALNPDIICNEQADVTIKIEGTGFLTIRDLAGNESVPTVTIGTKPFIPKATGCGGIAGPVAEVQSCTGLEVTIPQGTLNVGTLSVRIKNPQPADCTSEPPLLLTVIAPPSVTEVTPDLICPAAEAKEVKITGTGFLVIDGTAPSVKIGNTSLTSTASNCSDLSGSQEKASLCSSLTVTIPANTAVGLQSLIVTNPIPTGCNAAEVNIFIAAAPVITTINPPDICSALASTVLNITGNNLLVIDNQVPTLSIGGKNFIVTPSGCTEVSGVKETLQTCTGLSFTVAQNDLPTGQNVVTLTNPTPATCSSTGSLTLEVVPPPTIASVVPTKLCIGGGSITITGTGFRDGATVKIDNWAANTVVVTDSTQIIATFMSDVLTAGGPFEVMVQNVDGCSAIKQSAITVVPGPQLFFADPPVVFNGINTQITLYGSGVTGDVSSVAIRPQGSTDQPLDLITNYDSSKPNRVQAIIPKSTEVGTYDVILKDQTTCEAVLLGGIKVVEQVTLKLASVSPNFGYTKSTTAITVFADKTVGGGFKAVPRLYLNPTSGTQAAGLNSVTFVDETRITAVAPKGMAVDEYDIIAVNPDGGVGLLTKGFKVVDLPPPTVTNITPGSIANKSGQAITVIGDNFRSPSARLYCLDANSGSETMLNATVSTVTSTQVNLLVDVTSFANGAVCVVQIVNNDNTYADFSSLVVTNPAQNLSAFKNGPNLVTGRRALAAVSNQATAAARFVYAMGGDTGSVTNALNTVEVAPVDIFGQPAAFFTQTYHLTTPRSFAGAANIGRCIYLAGGIHGTTVLDTVERACVLDPAEKPEILDLDLKTVTTDGLGAGLWYYQVSAVMPADHPLNPDGETLPSDPFPLLLPALTGRKITVTLTWAPVTGAVGYRVYRSETADVPGNALELIATISGDSSVTFTDTGLAPQGINPLQLGSTGKWHVVGSPLATPRSGAAVAISPDPGDTTGTKYFLYVIGGKSASAALSTYEHLPITINPDGSQSVGTFSSSDTVMLPNARWQIAAFSVGNDNASFVKSPTHYIYVGAGFDTESTTKITDVDVFEVLSGGSLNTPISLDKMSPHRAGYGYAVANNFLFAFGGQQGTPSTSVTAAKICENAGAGCSSGPPVLENWNTATSMQVPRYLMGSAIQSGFIYILGGKTTAEDATPSTEYTIW